MNQNTKVINEAFKNFRHEIDKKVTEQLNLICQNVLVAALRARLSAQGGHDYTGNLINSIVVVLYDEGAISNVLTAGRDGLIRRPLYRKMSGRKKPYVFKTDYSGGHGTKFTADVPTNRGYADEDIEAFVNSHQPSFTKGYCITVAYTVEYANWVETQRQTTGFLESQRYAGKQMRLSFVPLKAA